MALRIETEMLGRDAMRLSLFGALDIPGADELERAMGGYTGLTHIFIIDLTGVSYIASMGIRALVSHAKAVAAKQNKMALLAPSGDVKRVFASTGVDRLIPIFDSLNAALAALR